MGLSEEGPAGRPGLDGSEMGAAVGLRLRLWDSGVTDFRDSRLGFRVQGSGFRVQGLGFRVQGLGFRVQGLGIRV